MRSPAQQQLLGGSTVALQPYANARTSTLPAGFCTQETLAINRARHS